MEPIETNHCPDWFNGKQVNEVIFCNEYVRDHPMKYINGELYDVNGAVDAIKVKENIYEMVSPYLVSDVECRINKIYNNLKYEAKVEDIKIMTDRINFNNGTYYTDIKLFEPERKICLNRLPVNYNPSAPKPKIWLQFVEGLLEPDDILTLQEYMGYCLIPSNTAQKMLMLVGKGGEGKSRVGRVMRAILGDNMNTSSVQKLATDRFARADLEGRLLMLDDDMQMEALTKTDILKTIVTMEDKMDLERKGKQSTQGYIYSRIMGFSNGCLQSLFDKTDGFYRRQIILMTKERPENRVDDSSLGKKLIDEVEGIVLWCLEGLHRLIDNEFIFTMSAAAVKNIEDSKKENNNLIDFLESTGYICLDKDERSSCKSLYDKYIEWCADNLKKPYVEKTFVTGLKALSGKYCLTYLEKIRTIGDKYQAGFKGIYPRV